MSLSSAVAVKVLVSEARSYTASAVSGRRQGTKPVSVSVTSWARPYCAQALCVRVPQATVMPASMRASSQRKRIFSSRSVFMKTSVSKQGG